MTLILDENIANVNLVLRFAGALDREDYFLCQIIKDELKNNKLDSNEIENLKIFTGTCEKIIKKEVCQNTIDMLESIK